MGKDNEGMEMVPMIVHVMRYMINKERREKSSYNRHTCNVQGGPSVTRNMMQKNSNSPRLSIGFNPTPDPDNTREYYILHTEDNQVCNSCPLTQTKVAGLLAALPDGEGASPEPHPVRPQLGLPSPM